MKHRLYLQKISQKGASSTESGEAPSTVGVTQTCIVLGGPTYTSSWPAGLWGGLWVPRFHLMKGDGEPDRHQQPF